jgi:hypothetical protein
MHASSGRHPHAPLVSVLLVFIGVLLLFIGPLTAGVVFAEIIDSEGDGIEDSIDTDPLKFSNDFSNVGVTSGTITDRGGWFVRAQTTPVDKTVFVNITGDGAGVARIETCPNAGAEEISLDAEGEAAVFVCEDVGGGVGLEATRVLVGSVIARQLELRKPPTGQPGNATLVLLSDAQGASLGSPVTADPANTQPIRVNLVDQDNAAFGSFDLDAGESVDVALTTLASVQISILNGTVTVSVEGQTFKLNAGDVQTFSFPRAVMRTMFEEISGFLAAGAIRNGGIANSLKASVNNASTLVGSNDTAVREILGALLAKVRTFSDEGQISPVVRDTLAAQIDAVLAVVP